MYSVEDDGLVMYHNLSYVARSKACKGPDPSTVQIRLTPSIQSRKLMNTMTTARPPYLDNLQGRGDQVADVMLNTRRSERSDH